MSIFDILKKNGKGISPETATAGVPTGKIEWIIAGLGNPGTEYENTRHNAGFLALDRFAAKCGATVKRLKFKSLTGETAVNGVKVLLIKPTTYMNKSGEALREAMAFYKVPPEKTLVIFDDISGEVGTLRIRKNGSDGGHNGIKNIIYLTGSDKYPRIKIGVGGKPHPDYDLAAWVTSAFKKTEGETLERALENAANAAEMIIGGDMEAAMNKFNGKSAT